MNQEQIMMFDMYTGMKNIPILLENVPLSAFKNVTVLEANCDMSELNGHYEGMDFVGPDWYQELQKNSEVVEPVLILKDIN